MRDFLIKIINKFYKWIDTIAKDQVLHSYLSTVITNITFAICMICGICPWLSFGISGIVTVLIGLFKEYIIDKWLRHTRVEKKDLIADIVGTILGLITNMLFIISCQ